MNILVVAHCFPMPDRQTGAFRFWQILNALIDRHQLVFCAVALDYQERTYGKVEVERYRRNLRNIGIETYGDGELRGFFRNKKFDIVFFEHYRTLHPEYVKLDDLRFWQPQARVIVDTVDVEFQRLMSRAEITQKTEDREEALKAKAEEMSVYGDADLVLTTSEPDKALLERLKLQSAIEVVPLIHFIPSLPALPNQKPLNLLFVGNFELDANVDAMIYFTSEIFPLIKLRLPGVRLTIAGNAPTDEIRSLADEDIDVLGYVPDLLPIYSSSSIAVVPIRWGGGLKGKVLEAMSFGLPVVATVKGLEGFGLVPGTNVMVGTTPEAFAKAVIDLFSDVDLYHTIRVNGWKFVNENYSQTVVANKIEWIFEGISRYPIKRLAWIDRSLRQAKHLFDRYVLWRFASARKNLTEA